MGVLFPLLPFGYSSPTREEFSPLSWKCCYPLPAGRVMLKREIECTPLTWEYCSPSFPSGIPPPLVKSAVLYHGSIDCPLPAGFPRNRSPLKGNPPFRGTPSALGHEGVRGRRLYGAAMLCRLQCARFAKRVAHCRRTFRQPSALIRSPRRSRGLRPVSAW